MPRLSMFEVRDTIIDRMVNNVYPVGAKLPTAWELATEVGVHRNTASKAYNLLAELGLVASKPGKGTYAVAVVDGPLADQSVLAARRWN
jgi:DNA-binding GntR family transcriptional regulator